MTVAAKDRPFALSLVLSGEGVDKLADPSTDDVSDLLGDLDPSKGPGFACLAEAVEFGDYVQVAGGFDLSAGCQRYCVERRVYVRTSDDRIVSPYDYYHLVAGFPDTGHHGETTVKTNGFKVACRTNEVLFLEDAIAIFHAFMETRDLPTDYEWRSNRSEVDRIGELGRN